MRTLAAIFAGATAATVLLLVAIARRGAPAPDIAEPQWSWLWDKQCNATSPVFRCELPSTHTGPHGYVNDAGTMNWWLDSSDDWATDPRTAELATGGGQEGAGR